MSVIRHMGAEFITATHSFHSPFNLSQEHLLPRAWDTVSHTLSVLLFPLIHLVVKSLLLSSDQTLRKQLQTWLKRTSKSRSLRLASGSVYYTTYKEVRSGEGWFSVCMLMPLTPLDLYKVHLPMTTVWVRVDAFPVKWHFRLPAFVVDHQLSLARGCVFFHLCQVGRMSQSVSCSAPLSYSVILLHSVMCS